MKKQSICLIASLTALGIGQLTIIEPATAQGRNNPRNNSDNTGVIVQPALRNGNFVLIDIPGNAINNGQAFITTSADLRGGFGLSQEVIDSIPNVSIGVSLDTTGSTGDGSDTATQQGGESETITICLGNPCLPDEDGGKAITLNDLAKLIEDDLNQSLSDLLAAEELERKAAYKPRRSARRRSSNACISPVVKARREFITKLQQSREFAEKIEPLKLENYGW